MSFDIEKFRENFFSNRNIKDKEKEEFCLFDFEKDNLDPFLFSNMDKTIIRLKKAIDNKEKILVYTDYDCDGIPSAVIWTDFFNKIKYKNFEIYIPHRHNEGYGLHKNVLERFLCNNYSLIITADLGITNIKEVDFILEKGADIILSDHHLPIIIDNKEVLPKTEFLINPNVSYEKYPNKNLCGAGVSWKIIHAFLVKYREEFGVALSWEKWLLDMVAIATVADLMELRGETRKLCHFGLKVLSKSQRSFVNRICLLNKIKQKNINEKDIAFNFAPMINAASRMDHPILAYKAIISNEKDIDEKFLKLKEVNKDKKEHIKDIKDFIKNIDFSKEGDIILIGDENWSPGVVGLISQYITENENKISLVWGGGEDKIIGSIRAPEAYGNVVDLLTFCKDIFLHFGGHEKAGGFSLHKNNILVLKKKLKKYKVKKNNKIKKDFFIDSEIFAKDVNQVLFEEIRKLSPFGIGNQAPIFLLKDKVKSYKKFGKNNEHIEFFIDENISSVLFNIKEEEVDKILKLKELIGTFEYDHWRDKYLFKINLDIIK